MKVLQISTAEDWRGGEQQIMYLHRSLLDLGVESIVACKQDSDVHKYCNVQKLPCKAFPFNSAYDIKSAIKLLVFVRREKIDLLHAHTSKGHTIMVLATLLGLKKPLILSRRVDFPVKRNWLSKLKYNHPSISRIICVSDAIKDITAPQISEKENLLTIHSGVDIHKFSATESNTEYLKSKHGLPDTVVIIGNTSALADHKDYFTFIDTAEKVFRKKPTTHFFIIGEGPMEDEIAAYIKAKNLSHKITMTGFLPEIEKAMKSLDIFLFTSKTEGLGTSVLDAMAAGIPIVATKAGGVPEMIKNDENGMLADVYDSTTLSELVLKVIENPKLAQRLTKNAMKTVQKFDYRTTASKTLKVYQEVLSESTSSRI